VSSPSPSAYEGIHNSAPPHIGIGTAALRKITVQPSRSANYTSTMMSQSYPLAGLTTRIAHGLHTECHVQSFPYNPIK